MNFVNWGLIDYELAVKQQLELVERIAQRTCSNHIVFCTHPPTVTLGRASKPEDVTDWSGPIVSVSRGGRATYHGPSQLVVYPLIDLSRDNSFGPARDLHQFLRGLEAWTVKSVQYALSQMGSFNPEFLSSLNLSGGGEQSQRGDLWRTGVWAGERKLASIGIAVKKWVSYHGIAINLLHDPKAFQGIRACGYQSETMTSLETLTGQKLSADDLIKAMTMQIAKD